MSCNLLVVTGPTASGKTRRAVQLARALGGEIVSADSRQVYRGMDLGTGKDLAEYDEGGVPVPVHLIDICPAGYKYNLYEWLRDAHKAISDIRARGRLPIVCGGTGLYVESLLKGLQLPQVPCNTELRESLRGESLEALTRRLESMKALHNTTDVDTCARAIRAIEIAEYYREHPEAAALARPQPLQGVVTIGVEIGREERRRRITERLRSRIDSGMVEEVQRLISEGVNPDDLIYYGLEYKYLTLHCTGALTAQQMFSSLETAIHQFAKRQMTWFRGMEKRGFPINWIPYDDPDFLARALSLVEGVETA